ncbi:MAG: ATP-binding protein [Coriobacteriia bacterium]|nr:ATP-binding protein [Coriobacteriia bacterium]
MLESLTVATSETGQGEMAVQPYSRTPRWLILNVIIAVLAIAAIGAWIYHDQESSLRERAESELRTIAYLKADDIAIWRADRLADGVRVTAAPELKALLGQWLANPTPETAEPLVETLESLRYGDRYRDVILVDTSGTILLSTGEDPLPLGTGERLDLRSAMYGKAPVLTELTPYPNASGAHIDVIAPVHFTSPDGVDTPRPAGAIILRADTRDFLYPRVQTWPTASRTAETLLVRRDGPEVVFLNEVRHLTGAAMSFRLPITAVDSPAVKAVLGERGIVEGIDYRGQPVIAYLAEIPGSSWLMIAKVDTEEAFAAWRGRASLLILVLATLIASAIGAPAFLWQRAKSSHLLDTLETERSLRVAEAQLGVTLASIGDGVIATDAAGLIQFINPVATRLTGWPESEAIGRPIGAVFDVRDEESGDSAPCPVSTVIEVGDVCTINGQVMLVSRGGTARPVGESGAPIRDEAGAIVGVVIVFRDQSDERTAREILRESAQRYRELFDNILDGFAVHEVIVDEDGTPCDYRFISVNPAFERLTGLKASSMVGKRVLEVLPGTEPEWIERYGAVALTGTPVEFESHSAELGKDFEVFAFSPREGHFAVVFRDVTERTALRRELEQYAEHLEQLVDERTQALQATNEELTATNEELHEITEELQATNEELTATNEELHEITEELHAANEELTATNEELQATTEELTTANDVLQATSDELADANHRLTSANDAKSRFLRAMSHELRTPLNSIIGFSGLMLSGLAGDLNEEQQRQLEMIDQSGRHLLALINDILDLSRIEAGRVQVEIEPFDLEKLVGELVESVRPESERKGLSLDLEIADGLDLSVFPSDSMRVGQILLNLLGNAVKFTERGGISVRARMLGTDTLGISVIDTGPGIRSQDHDRIFGEFVQAIGPSAPDKEGTGLGLAISRRLAELLGGSILLRSRVGHGSTFTVVLPIDPHTDA